MSELIKVSIIVPVFIDNQSLLDMTVNMFLTSLQNSSFKSQTEVILIDDKSKLPNIKWSEIIDKFKDINLRIIQNEKNIGFLKSTKVGIQNSNAKYILMSNNDIFVGKNVVESLYKILESNKEVAAIGPRLSNQDNYSGQEENFNFNLQDYSEQSISKLQSEVEVKNIKVNKVREVNYLIGAFLLFSRSDYDKVKGLDEMYGMGYYEEVDLLCNFRKQLNKKVWVDLNSFVFHGSTSGKSPSMSLRGLRKLIQFNMNGIYFALKHGVKEASRVRRSWKTRLNYKELELTSH